MIPFLSMVLIILGTGGVLLGAAWMVIGAIEGQSAPTAVLRPLLAGVVLFVIGLLIPVEGTAHLDQGPGDVPIAPGDVGPPPGVGRPPVQQVRGHLQPGTMVATRLRKACALGEKGVPACWGEPAPIGDQAVVEITLGREHGCVLRTDGTADCWGDVREDDTRPWEANFDHIAASLEYTCGLKPSGAIACWGSDAPRVSAGERYTRISAGPDYTCGLTRAGEIRCFGCEGRAVCTPPEGPFADLSAGHHHACALRPDQTVSCWGNDEAGQTRAPDGPFQAVSAGWNHSCGVDAAGALRCWGCAGRLARLMPGSQDQCDPPAGTFVAVSAGDIWGSCAVASDGSPICWGGLHRVEEPR